MLQIRNIIYRNVLVHSAPIPLFHSRPAVLRVLPSEDLDSSLLTSPKQGAHLQPSKNAFVHTCRQAYRECSGIYYGQNTFHIFSGIYLLDFVNSHQPIHIQSIRKLGVRRLENATGLNLGMVLRDEERPFAHNYHENVHSVEILRHFHGLEELKMVSDLSEVRVVPNRLAWVAFLRGLIAVAQSLPNLRSISIFTRSRLSVHPPQKSCNLHFDAVPGWTYSFLTGHYTADTIVVIETLERAQEPLWSPAGRQKDRIGERIDNWLQRQGTFSR